MITRKQKKEIREFFGHNGQDVRVRVTKCGEVHKCDDNRGGRWTFMGYACDALEQIRVHREEYGSVD